MPFLNFFFLLTAAYLDPSTLKYLDDSEIKSVETELLKKYPIPKQLRGKKSRNTDENIHEQEHQQNLNMIDSFAKELG